MERTKTRLYSLYTTENLHRITAYIIHAYRLKDFREIRQLSRMIHPEVDIQNIPVSRLFSMMILRFHPDRLNVLLQSIESFFEDKNSKEIENYFNILTILDYIRSQSGSYRRVSGVEERDRDVSVRPKRTGIAYHDFVSALKQMEYGNLNVHYSPQILSTIEGDLELSGYHIQDLRGIEFCENLTGLDLSNNYIDDILPLSSLRLLESLNLSLNVIHRVEALSELVNLHSLDLSLNHITDIRPLFMLPYLESVNLVGNSVPDEQIHELMESGVDTII